MGCAPCKVSSMSLCTRTDYVPDDPPIGGEDAFGERRTVVSAKCARRVDLVAQAREQDLALALKVYLFPVKKT